MLERLFNFGSKGEGQQAFELVIVGLGNPGPEYSLTRHNAGFWLIDRIADQTGIKIRRLHKTVHGGEGKLGESSIALARPRTFVNKSGDAVRYLLVRYQIPPEKLLIAYDDIHIPVGKLRLRSGGSAGGHNGMKSVISAVNTTEFPRIRIGVGEPSEGEDQIGYVLGRPEPTDKQLIADSIDTGISAITLMLNTGIDGAMSEFNG